MADKSYDSRSWAFFFSFFFFVKYIFYMLFFFFGASGPILRTELAHMYI